MSTHRLFTAYLIKITKSTTLQYFQFKITHGFYPTNAYLKKGKIQETNLCENCEIEDTLEHYFVTCRTTQTLWEQMKNLINPISCLSNTQILFGVLKTNKLSLTVSWANLILKYYIHSCKCNNRLLSFAALIEYLKYQILIEKESGKTYKNHLSFTWKWQIIDQFLNQL